MAFNVRIFGYQGIVPLKVVEGEAQARSDSVFQLKQPHLWVQVLSADVTAISSVAPTILAPYSTDLTSVLRIEIPDGQSIRYEVNSPNRSLVASTNSPILSGRDQIQFGAGWRISLIDAAGLA